MKRWIAVMLAAAMTLSLAACGGKGNTSGSSTTPPAGGSQSAPQTGGDFKGTVKVGHLAVISGPDDYLGVPTTAAMQDYLDEVNANGGWLGYKVELVTYDIARGVEEVAPAATKMIEQDKCIAILGPTYSAGATSAQPVVTAAGVPLIALSATNAACTVNEQTGEVYDWMFRVCFTDNYQAEGLANFLSAEGVGKVGILSCVSNSYSVGMETLFTDIFSSAGGEITRTEYFNENDIDFRAQLTNIGNSGCQAIFMPVPNIRYGVLAAQQARELGIEVPFVLPDSVYGSELLEAADELEGSYISTGMIDDDPAYEDYRADFRAKHNMEANMFCYYGLDCLMLLEDAIKEANSLDSADIRAALDDIQDAPVFTGTLTIDPATHNPVDKAVTIMTIKDGGFELYKVFDPKAK